MATFARVWETLEHIAALIGLVSTVGGVIWAFRYRRKLTATATRTRFQFMPGFAEKISQHFGEMNEAKVFGLEVWMREITDNKVFWTFSIRNKGRKEIQELKLHIPFRGYYRTDLSPEAFRFAMEIPLGNLRSGVSKIIHAWTNDFVVSDEEQSLRVTYTDDVVYVQVARQVHGKLGRLAEILQEDNCWWLKWLIFTSTFAALLLAVEIAKNVRIEVQQPTTMPAKSP